MNDTDARLLNESLKTIAEDATRIPLAIKEGAKRFFSLSPARKQLERRRRSFDHHCINLLKDSGIDTSHVSKKLDAAWLACVPEETIMTRIAAMAGISLGKIMVRVVYPPVIFVSRYDVVEINQFWRSYTDCALRIFSQLVDSESENTGMAS